MAKVNVTAHRKHIGLNRLPPLPHGQRSRGIASRARRAFPTTARTSGAYSSGHFRFGSVVGSRSPVGYQGAKGKNLPGNLEEGGLTLVRLLVAYCFPPFAMDGSCRK